MSPSEKTIREQLDRLTASTEFARTDRMVRFLRFVVEHSLTGHASLLRERQIGIEVFDRDEDWDPKLDNIVRSEARRLRIKLASYAATGSPDETVRITIPKGGYTAQFMDLRPVEELRPPELVSPDSSVLVSTFPRVPWRLRALFGFIVLLLIAATVGWTLRHTSTVTAKTDSFEVVPFSTEAGQQFSPAISPDGTRIAFVWNGGGDNYDIYVKSIATGKIQQITNDSAADIHPAWSPNERKIAFLRRESGDTQLIVKTLAGGSERILQLLHDPLSMWSSANPLAGCQSLTWSPDGGTLVVTDALGSTEGYGLVLISAETGERTILTQPPGEDQDCYSRFSPDGKHIAFVRHLSHGIGDIYTMSRTSSEVKRITRDGTDIRGLDWTASGKEIVFASKRGGSYELRTIESNGGISKPLPADTASAAEPTTSRVGEWMAYVETEENWNIWRAPLSGNHLGRPERFVASSGQNHSPSYSPDGKTLAFVSDRSGSPEIWFADALNGSNPRQQTHFAGPWLGTIRWSPDSSSIVFDARPNGHSSIFRMATNGGVPKVFEEQQFEVRRPGWARDGKSVYFDTAKGGRPQIWKRTLASGSTQPISPPGALDPQESYDGHRLYYLQAVADKLSLPDVVHDLWVSEPDGSNAARVLGVSPNPDLDWTVGRDVIYFAEAKGSTANFFALNLRSQLITKIGEESQLLSPATPSLAVSPDGKWLLYATIDHTKSDIKIRKSAQ